MLLANGQQTRNELGKIFHQKSHFNLSMQIAIVMCIPLFTLDDLFATILLLLLSFLSFVHSIQLIVGSAGCKSNILHKCPHFDATSIRTHFLRVNGVIIT